MWEMVLNYVASIITWLYYVVYLQNVLVFIAVCRQTFNSAECAVSHIDGRVQHWKYV